MGKSASPDPDQVHADVRASARQACYKARDAFYACLEKDLRKEIGSVGLMCPVDYNKARAQYEANCPDFWVKHFDKLYSKDKDAEIRSAWFDSAKLVSSRFVLNECKVGVAPLKVKHFDGQYCKDKRRQRLLDDKTTRKDPLLLPQTYTFKNTTTSS